MPTGLGQQRLQASRRLPRVATSSYWRLRLTSRNDVAAVATDGTATSESRRSSGDAEVDDEGTWHAEASVVATRV
jgi:hypothetical protein